MGLFLRHKQVGVLFEMQLREIEGGQTLDFQNESKITTGSGSFLHHKQVRVLSKSVREIEDTFYCNL